MRSYLLIAVLMILLSSAASGFVDFTAGDVEFFLPCNSATADTSFIYDTYNNHDFTNNGNKLNRTADYCWTQGGAYANASPSAMQDVSCRSFSCAMMVDFDAAVDRGILSKMSDISNQSGMFYWSTFGAATLIARTLDTSVPSSVGRLGSAVVDVSAFHHYAYTHNATSDDTVMFIDGAHQPLNSSSGVFTDIDSQDDPLRLATLWNAGGPYNDGYAKFANISCVCGHTMTPSEIAESVDANGYLPSMLINPDAVPVISAVNCTSCDVPIGDSSPPFATNDTTPTFSLSTDIEAHCRISGTNSSYTDMTLFRNCTTSGSTDHICTVIASDAMTTDPDHAYITCANPLNTSVYGSYLAEMGMQFAALPAGDTDTSIGVNACPANTPSILVFGLAAAIVLTLIIVAAAFRMDFLGLLASLGLSVLSWTFVDCSSSIGYVILGSGVLLAAWFGLRDPIQ
ncbi:MAG TPA: hypothetical protein VII92_14780 [Anaerolineae bacterium]